MPGFDPTAALHAAMIAGAKVCAPLLLASLAAGLVTAVLQAVTQINDSSVAFLPKLCATLAAGTLAAPFISRTMTDLLHRSFVALIQAGQS